MNCPLFVATACLVFSAGLLPAQVLYNEGSANVDYQNAVVTDFRNDRYSTTAFGGSHVAESSLIFGGGQTTARATSVIQPGVLAFRLTGASEVTQPVGDTHASASAFANLTYNDRIGFYAPSQPLGTPLALRLSVAVNGATRASIEPRPHPGNNPPGGDPDPSPDGVGLFTVSTGFWWEIGAPDEDPFAVGNRLEFEEVDRLFDEHLLISTGRDLLLTVPNDPDALYTLTFRANGYAAITSERSNGVTTPASSSFDVDFSAGLAWKGVTSAFAGDVALTDLSVFSESGVDYNRSYAPVSPVPESSTYAICTAAGLFALAACRRSRQLRLRARR
jgi:hypothetical protein